MLAEATIGIGLLKSWLDIAKGLKDFNNKDDLLNAMNRPGITGGSTFSGVGASGNPGGGSIVDSLPQV